MRRLLVIAFSTVALTGCARLEEAGGELKGIVDNVAAGGAPVYRPSDEAAAVQTAAAPAAAPAPTQAAAAPAPAPQQTASAASQRTDAPAKARPAPKEKAPRQVAARPAPKAKRDQASYSASDPTVFLHMTMEGLSKTVRDGTLKDGTLIEITAQVDGRFNRQIIIDLRTGEGQAASRNAGDCVQVLLPYFIDQKKFDTGRYIVRGTYRKAERDHLFTYEKNHYEAVCGLAYLEARWIDKAP